MPINTEKICASKSSHEQTRFEAPKQVPKRCSSSPSLGQLSSHFKLELFLA